MALLLVGWLIGFLSAIGKDYLLEQKKQLAKEKTFKRQKLEEVFVLMSNFFKSSLVPLEHREIDKESNNAKLSMLIRFYFPHLNGSYKQFLQKYSELNQNTTSSPINEE